MFVGVALRGGDGTSRLTTTPPTAAAAEPSTTPATTYVHHHVEHDVHVVDHLDIDDHDHRADARCRRLTRHRRSTPLRSSSTPRRPPRRRPSDGDDARRKRSTTTAPPFTAPDPTPPPETTPSFTTPAPQITVQTFGGQGGTIDVRSDGTSLTVLGTDPAASVQRRVADDTGPTGRGAGSSSRRHRTTHPRRPALGPMVPTVTESDMGGGMDGGVRPRGDSESTRLQMP